MLLHLAPKCLGGILPGAGNGSGVILSSAVEGGRGLGFDPATAFLNADGVNAVFSFLNSDTDTKVISTPRAVTLDNETGHLVGYSCLSNLFDHRWHARFARWFAGHYTNLGTILNVTPHISANDDIQLRIQPEVSSLAGTATKTVAGVVNQADIFDFRRIDTQVLIPSGNTLVMGGLLQNDVTKGSTKVPLLGDIPVLGLCLPQQV